MLSCISSSVYYLRGYASVIHNKGYGSVWGSSTPRGICQVVCDLSAIDYGARVVIKLTNSNTTHNLSPDTLTKVPLMGNNPITNGTGGTDFTINAGNSDVTCNFTGVVVVAPSLYGVADNSGLQFKMKVFIDEVEQDEVSLSHTDFEQGCSASFPFLILSVTTGQKISIRTIKNTFSGTVTIGAADSCYLFMEKL